MQRYDSIIPLTKIAQQIFLPFYYTVSKNVSEKWPTLYFKMLFLITQVNFNVYIYDFERCDKSTFSVLTLSIASL